MIVREYQKSDLSEISRLFYNTVHQVNSRDYTKKQIAAWAGEIKDESFWQERFSNYLVYVVEANHIIVGFTNFKPTGYIDCFYVHHQWQGQGVGSLLIKQIELEARKNQISLLFLNASVTAMPFFKAKGFVVIREQERLYNGCKFKQYYMEKTLKNNYKIE
ncbi:GCN5-related N-acetyltransferase [Stanieria sp. NIES-3757]|nr:GCN5-related N-acetyltransferase [Stanieria sp. NIES-3757]